MMPRSYTKARRDATSAMQPRPVWHATDAGMLGYDLEFITLCLARAISPRAYFGGVPCNRAGRRRFFFPSNFLATRRQPASDARRDVADVSPCSGVLHPHRMESVDGKVRSEE